MNVYDKAHETARALKESSQYKAFREAAEVLKSNDSAWKMFQDYRTKQTEIQQDILSGKDVPQERMEEMNRLFEVISGSSAIMEFLRREMELIRIVEDVQKIILQKLDLDLEA